ncbi:hypothetical protein JHK86_039590 [Glycine max]|nr:hypothetical protein JHK86_039590 [Glycine max]
MGQMDHYENDFEAAMLKDTSSYYSRKASNWILEDSCPDYMLKKVQHELLSVYTNQLLKKEHSGYHALLRDDKKVQHELLSVYTNQLLKKEHSGYHALLRDDKALKEALRSFATKVLLEVQAQNCLPPFVITFLKKEEVVKLLAYISGKDLFAKFYRKKLARRLLFDKSANDDHERSILTKLKQQCGGQFTSKMEGMVNHF